MRSFTPPRPSASGPAEVNFQEAQNAKQLAVEFLVRNETLERHLHTGGGAADLVPFFAGARQMDDGLTRAREMSSDDARELSEIDTQQHAKQTWEKLAANAVNLTADGRRPTEADAVARLACAR